MATLTRDVESDLNTPLHCSVMNRNSNEQKMWFVDILYHTTLERKEKTRGGDI